MYACMYVCIHVYMYVCMHVCMHVCTKSFLKTTTNSLCVCTHVANKADSDSDSEEEQIMCVIDAFSVSAQEWCIDNDGKCSCHASLPPHKLAKYFLLSFIVIPHQQHTKHTQTKLYSQYSQKVPFMYTYPIEYINSNMTLRLHKIKCT